MTRLVVTCLLRATEVAARFEPTHAITLLDPTMDALAPEFGADVRTTRLLFFDQENEAAKAAVLSATSRLVDVLAGMSRDRAQRELRLLLHCHAGVSRSTAAAYIALAMFSPAASERHVFAELLRLTRRPWPNARMVAVADALLGRGGRLIEPLDRYRALHPLRLQAYRRLNLRRGIVSAVER